MKIDINKVVPNPFRNFELDPIDDTQVDRLAASINQLGFFSGVTARKRDDGMYELAAGHHRWKAAIRAGEAHIEAVVDHYSDNEMRRIMAIENLTQRGSNTGAQQDAVAAFAYQVAYEVLSDRISLKNLSEKAIGVLRGKVLNDGPGINSIYAAINGFPIDEHMERMAEDEKSVMISIGDVRKAVAALKDSGHMAKIVAKAHAFVEAERAEDAEKAAEVERKAAEKRKAEEERFAAEQERKRKAAEEAERRSKEAAKAAADAEKRKTADAAKRRAEAEAAAKEAEKRRKEREKAEDAARERREQAAKQEILRQREERDRMAREAEERRKVQAQLDQEKIYDTDCNPVFPDPAYAEVFRKTITKAGVREVIDRSEQLDIAKQIRKSADDWKKFSNAKLGTDHIVAYLNEVVAARNAEQRKAEADRQAELAKINKTMRIHALWAQVKKGVVMINYSLEQLAKEHAQWDKADGDFPYGHELVDCYGDLRKIDKVMRRMYGGRWGIPMPEDEPAPTGNVKRIGNR